MKLRFLHYVVVQPFSHLIRASFCCIQPINASNSVFDSTLRNDSEMAHFHRRFASVTHAEPHILHTKTKDTISRCELLTWLFEIIQQKGAFEQSLV